MNKMNIPKNFYCDSEQFKHLEIFKTKVNLINKYYTEEVQELLFANNMTDYTKYMFSSSEDIIEKLFKDDTVKFIDYILWLIFFSLLFCASNLILNLNCLSSAKRIRCAWCVTGLSLFHKELYSGVVCSLGL